MGRLIRGLDADERRAERREQLLDTALDLFAANGYINTTIEQICSTAFIGTKSFYEVFENREACYLALLQRTSERLEEEMVAVARQGAGNEKQALPALIAAFAHGLMDDPRVARVTFGIAAGISSTVERQRRTNRRWAGDFLEGIWDRYDGVLPAKQDAADKRMRHAVAIGLVGGLFDLISDWLLDANLKSASELETLIDDMTTFYITVRRGLGTH
ncbi:TetR/AcrR family transcriptional regulator [Kribbella qitaiheensis]|uniref:TetR/AcrR family transcriptional regulator n=1 Tax=Kribbella qitaiheensis TaxID=1544730 RepID=A0A7G6X458_9ACTN|nr:TetR/AcrR family transcriptional regulator [Kribbella qitaiheensis]QNE21023.1 TetR/AcrR family transcriptional regulator [Kribbella qitaiheensis]